MTGGVTQVAGVSATPSAGANVFSPSVVTSNTGNAAATANWNAITAMIVACALAGGGDVVIPPAPAGGAVPISAALTPLSGVRIKGATPQLVYNTIPDSGLTTLVGSQGGTILLPTGAFAAISWNTAVLGVPASQTAFSQAALTNMSIENMGFSGALGGTWAIQAGNTNNPSAWYSQFKNLYATGFTGAGGGFSITNYQHCQFDGNYTFGCQWGQLHVIDVASASLAPGNSTYKDLYNCIPTTNNIACRNITFITGATTGGAGNNNEFKFDRVQSNRFNGQFSTQAATMTAPIATVITNTSASIVAANTFAAGDPVGFSATTGTVGGQVLAGTTYYVSATGLSGAAFQVSATVGGAVITFNASGTPNVLVAKFTITDGTKWAVGMPVTPSATLNGLTVNTVYFVTSLSGTTMTVSKSYGGVPIPMSAASAVNLTTQGFPCFEMIGLPGSTMTNIVMDNIDVEGITGAGMFFQNCSGLILNVSQVPSTAQAVQSIVFRGVVNAHVFAPQAVSTDFDNNTNGAAIGFFGTRFGNCVGYMGYGQWLDQVTNRNVTSFGSVFNTQGTGDITFDPSVNNGVSRAQNIGIAPLITKTITGASSAIVNLNVSINNNTAASTTTMPALVAGNNGCRLHICNTSAGTQTYTTAGELINNIAGRNSFTLAAGASIEFQINNTQWWIAGSSATMTAGAVAAPS